MTKTKVFWQTITNGIPRAVKKHIFHRVFTAKYKPFIADHSYMTPNVCVHELCAEKLKQIIIAFGVLLRHTPNWTHYKASYSKNWKRSFGRSWGTFQFCLVLFWLAPISLAQNCWTAIFFQWRATTIFKTPRAKYLTFEYPIPSSSFSPNPFSLKRTSIY